MNPHLGGGTVSADFFVFAPENKSFVSQSLTGFTNLDSLSFEYDGAASACGGACSGDFAIDNIAVTTAICDISTAGNACSNPSPPNPIPEPETYAMLLAGLGVLGLVARRRKQKEAVAA